MFSAPVIKSDLSVKPEVIITGENRVDVESRFPCNFKLQLWSFEATEVLRPSCSTTAAISKIYGQLLSFQVVSQKGEQAGTWQLTWVTGAQPEPWGVPSNWHQLHDLGEELGSIAAERREPQDQVSSPSPNAVISALVFSIGETIYLEKKKKKRTSTNSIFLPS